MCGGIIGSLGSCSASSETLPPRFRIRLILKDERFCHDNRAMRKPMSRAILSARSQRLRTLPRWISAFADWTVTHVLSLPVLTESRSLRRQIECLSHIPLYQIIKIRNSGKHPPSKNKFIAIYGNAKKCRRIEVSSFVLYTARLPFERMHYTAESQDCAAKP
jgi:hypothetical protein